MFGRPAGIPGWRHVVGALTFAHATHSLTAVDLPLRWRWSNPTPHGNTVYDMTSGFGLVIQAAENGQLYSSFDQVLWEPHDTGTTNSLRALAFLGERLIITGASGTALYADSLGDIRPATLTPMTTDWLEGLAVSGSLLVAVGDNGAIYKSATGTNWMREIFSNFSTVRARSSTSNRTAPTRRRANFIARPACREMVWPRR